MNGYRTAPLVRQFLTKCFAPGYVEITIDKIDLGSNIYLTVKVMFRLQSVKTMTQNGTYITYILAVNH